MTTWADIEREIGFLAKFKVCKITRDRLSNTIGRSEWQHCVERVKINSRWTSRIGAVLCEDIFHCIIKPCKCLLFKLETKPVWDRAQNATTICKTCPCKFHSVCFLFSLRAHVFAWRESWIIESYGGIKEQSREVPCFNYRGRRLAFLNSTSAPKQKRSIRIGKETGRPNRRYCRIVEDALNSTIKSLKLLKRPTNCVEDIDSFYN